MSEEGVGSLRVGIKAYAGHWACYMGAVIQTPVLITAQQALLTSELFAS